MGKTKATALELQEAEFDAKIKGIFYPDSPNVNRADAKHIRFKIPEDIDKVLEAYQNAYKLATGLKISKATVIELALYSSVDTMKEQAAALVNKAVLATKI